MSFMEEQVLGYKSPLYGRRTAQFKLRPFTYFEAKQMLNGFSQEEQAILYGITGGIPEYLSRIYNQNTLGENIINLFFDESGRLFDEPGNLLKQELREPATYHSIISAIAGGASRLNEIATKTGLATGGCSNQIQSLISLRMEENGMDALFVECKWRKNLVDQDVIITLLERSGLFNYQNNYFMIFSKNGFTVDAKKYASQNKRIQLISFEEMNEY